MTHWRQSRRIIAKWYSPTYICWAELVLSMLLKKKVIIDGYFHLVIIASLNIIKFRKNGRNYNNSSLKKCISGCSNHLHRAYDIWFKMLRMWSMKVVFRVSRGMRKKYLICLIYKGRRRTRRDLEMAKQHRYLILGLFILPYYSNL